MSDVVKWGIIIAICVASLGVLVVFLSASGYLNGITSAISYANTWLGQYSTYLVQGRMLLNNFFPPVLLTVLIWFGLFYKIVEWSIGLIRMVIDAVYKD